MIRSAHFGGYEMPSDPDLVAVQAATKLQAHMRSHITRKHTSNLLHAARTTRAKRIQRPKEIMDLFIVPGVELQMSVSYPTDPTKAGRFTVIGPPRALAILQVSSIQGDAVNGKKSTRAIVRAARGIAARREVVISGVISPLSVVTLPNVVRRDAGIPQAATHFAFVYPLKHLKGRLHAINLTREPWAFAVIVGAYAYFDEAGTMLSLNALSIMPSPSVLHLVGPVTAYQQSALEMTKNGRMSDVTLDGLRAAVRATAHVGP